MKQSLIVIGKVSEYLIYGFLVFVLFIILSPRLPTKNLIRTYIVPTGSMAPTVLPGSVAFVNPKQTEPITGDIVAFLSPKDTTETILHRIIEVTADGYRTKGDFNGTADTWTVPSKNIQGTLVFAMPYVGHIAAFVKKPIGFGLLAVIPAVLLCLSSLVDIKNGIQEEYKKHKEKKASRLIIAAVAFFVLGFFVAQNRAKDVYASFFTEARIQGISISASFSSPTPSITPSPTTTPTPTPSATPRPTVTPTPRPHHDDDDEEEDDDHGCAIKFEYKDHGRHEDSDDRVEVHCKDKRITIHFRNLHSLHRIHYQYDYDSDEGRQGVLGDIDLDGESDITKDIFKGHCSSNTCTSNNHTGDEHMEFRFD